MPDIFSTPIVEVIIDSIGIAGARGPAGSNGTGVAVTGVLTGVFVQRNESGIFAANTDLIKTGSYLYSLLSSAGVSLLNGLTGVVNVTGTGIISSFIQGNTIIISGNTGAYANFLTSQNSGDLLNVFVQKNATGAFITSGQTGALLNTFVQPSQTGVLANQFYPLNANPSNYVTSAQTGILTNVFVQTNATGNFLTTSQTGNFATQSQIITLKTETGLYNFVTPAQSGQLLTVFVQPNSTGDFITRFQTGQFVTIQQSGTLLNVFLTAAQTGILTNVFVQQNSTGNFVTTSQTGGFATNSSLGATGIYLFGLINASSAGVGSLNGASGALTLAGAGNITVFTNGQTVTISGETGQYVTQQQSGTLLNTFVQKNQTGNFTSVQVTGSPILPFINISGISGINTLITGNNIVLINGGFIQGQISLLKTETGLYTFITPAQTGVLSNQFYPLNANPSNYVTATQTGILTNVFVQTNATGNFVTTANTGNFTTFAVTGSLPISYVNLSGISGINTFLSGNLVVINGGSIQGQISLLKTETGLYNFITPTQSGQLLNVFAQINQTGDFVTRAQTGNFIDVTKSGSLLNVFVQQNATGNFITSSQTGNFVTVAQTGFLTGTFAPFGRIHSKSITVTSPVNTDNIAMFYTDVPLTVTKVVAVLVGSSSPVVSGSLYSSVNRSLNGTELITNGITCNNTVGGNIFTSITNPIIGSGTFVFLKLTGVVGSVSEENVTVFFKYNN